MNVSYNKLFRMLIVKEIKKSKFEKNVGKSAPKFE